MMNFYSFLIRNILFPIEERVEKTGILKALKMLEKSQYWPEEMMIKWQLEKLREILRHAYKNTVFYNRKFKDIGFEPDDFKDFSDLFKLPILTKRDLKDHQKDLIARNLLKEDIHESTTGGTTADYTIFYRDNRSLNFKLASTIRHDRWCGWNIGDKEAIVWPASIDFKGKLSWKMKLKNRMFDRKLRIFAGVLDDSNLQFICKQLQDFKPALIRGFPNPISIIAEYINEKGHYKVRAKAIKSVGEPLTDSQRKLFESTFSGEVFNYYLSRESGTIASECEEHDKMHISAETLFLEFLNEGKPSRPGEPGNIVVTDLHNYGMPFIRYEIGDIGIPSNAKCACGRTLPLMEMTAGRESDFLISPHDGSKIMGLSLLVPFVENPKVGQLQIIQDKPNHIIVKLSKNEGFQEESLSLFKKTVNNIFHNKMLVSFEYVEKIFHEKSGKYRFVIRKDFSDASNQ